MFKKEIKYIRKTALTEGGDKEINYYLFGYLVATIVRIQIEEQ
jgi:hypothetical protein